MRMSNISVEPQLSPKSDPLSIVETAIEEKDKGDYESVWCVFDLDTIEKNKEIKAEVKRKAKKGNIHIADSFPCFEIWYLLHYNYSTTSYSSSAQVISELKKHIGDYCEQQTWIRKKNLFEFLQDKLASAKENAKRLDEYNKTNNVENGTKCSIYSLWYKIEDHLFGWHSQERLYV